MGAALKELSRLALERKVQKYPNMPAHGIVPPKYSDKDANGLTSCILDYIRLRGGFAARINSTGIFDSKLGKFRKSGSTNGVPDIIACVSGQMLGVEVKAGKDKLSSVQIEIQNKIEAAGGRYFVARDFESFYIHFNTK